MLHKIKASLSSAYHSIQSRKYLNIGLFIISLLLWYFFSIDTGFFFYIISATILNNFSSKPFVLGALFLLISIPLLLIFEEETLAEQMAVYVYYLLVSTVIVEIFAYIKNRKPTSHKDDVDVNFDDLETDDTGKHELPALPSTPPLQLPTRTISMEFVRPAIISNKVETTKEEIKIDGSEESTIESNTTSDFQRLFGDLSNSYTKKPPFKGVSFDIKFLLKYWNIFVVFISAIIPIGIFRFTGLPSFRDLTTVPYFYNTQSSSFDLSVIEKLIFNQFTQFISPEAISSIFFQFFFFLGTIATYYFLLKIQGKFITNSSYLPSKTNKILVLIISLLYVYNPFTFERFLMGHHFVLRGQLLFIPVLFYLLNFLDVFAHFKNPDFKLLTEKNITRFSHFGWALTLMAFLSTHAAVFAIYLLVFGILFIVVTNLKHIYTNIKKSDSVKIFNQLLKVLTVLLLVVLPTIIIFINRYANTPQQATYDTQTATQTDIERRIISAFSLKTPDDQNLVSKALIGAASWNTPSFVEVNDIALTLGNLRKISIYYSPKLNTFIILFMIALIGYCAYLADRYFKPLLFPFLLLLPIILILNFGYSLNFESVNSLFFKLPFSYTFREAGKFYGLFLALLTVLIVTYSEYFHKFVRRAVIAVFGFIILGNLIIFLPLRENIIYAKYPPIYQSVSDTCQRSDKTKVLFLPYNTYIYPSYSDIFTANFSKSLFNCEVVSPEYATLDNRDSNKKVTDTVEITNSKAANSINGIINTFTRSTPSNNPYETLKKELRTFGIYTLVIDTTKYQDTSSYDLGVFNTKLRQYIQPDQMQEDSETNIFVYSLK